MNLLIPGVCIWCPWFKFKLGDSYPSKLLTKILLTQFKRRTGKVERINQLHRGFAALHLAGIFTGLAFRENIPIDLNVILLSILLISIRTKFWFDDEAYFEDVETGVRPGGLSFGFGVILAIISWIVWGFAALYIKEIEFVAILMVIIFLISTFWIVASMIEKGAYAEQIPWLAFNVFYELGFFLIFSRKQSWNPFNNSFDNYTTGVIVVLIIVFLIDFGVTRILEQRRRN